MLPEHSTRKEKGPAGLEPQEPTSPSGAQLRPVVGRAGSRAHSEGEGGDHHGQAWDKASVSPEKEASSRRVGAHRPITQAQGGTEEREREEGWRQGG